MAIEMDTIYAENLSLLHFGDLMTLERLEPHFINAIHKLYKESRVEGMSIEIKSTNFSSFFGKKSAVLAIEFKKSKIKKLSANFFVLKNGNVYSLRLSRQIHATYLDTLREKPQVQKIELLKNSSLEETELKFNLVKEDILSKISVNYQEVDSLHITQIS